MATKLYNPTASPVVYSKLGHSLGGTERVEVPVLDEVGKRAVAKGRLVDETEPEPEAKEMAAVPEDPEPAPAKNRRASRGESAGSDAT